MMHYRVALSSLILVGLLTAPRAFAEAQWVWSQQGKDDASGKPAFFRKTFTLDEPDKTKGASRVEITADNTYILLVNGSRVGAGNNWQEGTIYDISPLLAKGENTVAVEAMSPDQHAALAARVIVKTKDGKTHEFSTDKTWKSTSTPSRGWEKAKFDDAKWEDSHVFGTFGKTAPWNATATFSDKPAKGDWAPQITPSIESTYLPQKPHGAWTFDLKDGDRVVLLGNTFVEREQQHGYIELALTTRWPDRNITFRNLGWSGDTVWGEARARFGNQKEGFEHLVKWVRACNPTVVIIAYGQNESFEGSGGLKKFGDGLATLIKGIEDTGARIAFIGPYKMENLGAPLPDSTKQNDNLYLYSDAIKTFASERGLPFIDLFKMPACKKCMLTQNNPADPADRTLHYENFPITSNNLHLTDLGYWHVANTIAWKMEPKPTSFWIQSTVEKGIQGSQGMKLSNVKTNEGVIRFTIEEPTLPAPNFHVNLPGNKQLRFSGEEIQSIDRILRVDGLAEGDYELRIDGKPYMKATAAQWKRGVGVTACPEQAQVEALHQAILRKNELFFHHWRPANETYLFLFRKHEQGNNAVEIPQFIPLIEEQEKKIAQLRKPVKHEYEVVKVKGEK